MKFKIAVSRMATGKDGYKHNKYQFGNSFHTETHTPDTLADLLTVEGYPVTMVHQRRDPKETGAAARGVSTYRHLENFVSMQAVFLDDDRAEPGVVVSWLSDDFFSQYGSFFYETKSSRPDAQKGRAVFILDRPIKSADALKEIQKAFMFRYPHIDQGTHDATRVWYGAPNTRLHKLGNVLPYSVLEAEILTPYRDELKRIEAEREARQAEKSYTPKTPLSPDAKSRYLEKSIAGIFEKVANTKQDRHSIVVWAGRKIGEYESTDWTDKTLLATVEAELLNACRVNGYTSKYSDSEILRNFNYGRTTANQAAPEPAMMAPKFVTYSPPPDSDPVSETPIIPPIPAIESTPERPQPVFNDDTAFSFAIDIDNYLDVVHTRQNVSSASDWKQFVELNYPELDSDHEYRIKLEENRRHRANVWCGRPRWEPSPTGGMVKNFMSCGVCEDCKKTDAANIHEKLRRIIYGVDQPEQDITLVTVYTKQERRKWTRELKQDGIENQVYPVRDGDELAFVILFADYRPDLGEILDPAILTEDRILKWLERPPDTRGSGRLIGSTADLRQEFKEKEWYEADRPRCPECNKFMHYHNLNQSWYCTREKCTQTIQDFETFKLSIPGIVSEIGDKVDFPEITEPVSDLHELQESLEKQHKKHLERLQQERYGVLGVTVTNVYIHLKRQDELLAEFNSKVKEPDPPKIAA